MTNYLALFLPSKATKLEPLDNLLKQDLPWNWSSTLGAFEAAVMSAPVLAFHNPEKPLTLENDASEYGLGSALLQDKKPIALLVDL